MGGAIDKVYHDKTVEGLTGELQYYRGRCETLVKDNRTATESLSRASGREAALDLALHKERLLRQKAEQSAGKLSHIVLGFAIGFVVGAIFGLCISVAAYCA